MTATLFVFLALASCLAKIRIGRSYRGGESAAGGSGRRLSEMRSGRADGARGAFKDLGPNSDRLTAAVHGSVDGFFPELCRIADLSGDASCCRCAHSTHRRKPLKFLAIRGYVLRPPERRRKTATAASW